MNVMVAFMVIRNTTETVHSPAEARTVVDALLGPLGEAARSVEPDGLGGFLVESTEDETAQLRVSGWWSAEGDVGEDRYELIAEMH